MTTAATETATVGTGRTKVVLGIAIFTTSLLVVFLLALVDADRVTVAVDRSSVEVGLPLAWVEQDQSANDVPSRATHGSGHRGNT